MKNPIVILNEGEIRQCVSVNEEALGEVAKGFTALAEGDVTLCPPFCGLTYPTIMEKLT
jgi:hypothetical protein